MTTPAKSTEIIPGRRPSELYILCFQNLPEHQKLDGSNQVLNVNAISDTIEVSPQKIFYWLKQNQLPGHRVMQLINLPGSTLTLEKLQPYIIVGRESSSKKGKNVKRDRYNGNLLYSTLMRLFPQFVKVADSSKTLLVSKLAIAADVSITTVNQWLKTEEMTEKCGNVLKDLLGADPAAAQLDRFIKTGPNGRKSIETSALNKLLAENLPAFTDQAGNIDVDLLGRELNVAKTTVSGWLNREHLPSVRAHQILAISGRNMALRFDHLLPFTFTKA